MLNTTYTPNTAPEYVDVRKTLFVGYDPSFTGLQYPQQKERDKVLSLLYPLIEEGIRMKGEHIDLLVSTYFEIAEANAQNKEENKPSTLKRDVMGLMNFIAAYGSKE